MLASASPRRRELLSDAGIAFAAASADIVEEQQPGESAEDFCRRLARQKAEVVLGRLPTGKAVRVLGADTIVVIDDQVLGKPRDVEDARRMLRLLSGRTHQVVTGVCLLMRDKHGTLTSDLCHAITTVRFYELTEAQISAYVASGEPMDKAGAYGIQGGAAPFVAGYEGDYDNVVGLPVGMVREMLGSLETAREFLGTRSKA